MTRCYLDHATTTPLDPRVREAMLPYLVDRFGSPSALHHRGRQAHAAVEKARASVAALVGARENEILFTASATEANNLALKGTALAHPRGGRILAAATEHISVLHPLRTLSRSGFELGLIPVDEHGLVDPEALHRELQDRAILVAIAHASAEIGTLQSLADLRPIARMGGASFHCDASASAGLLPWAPADELPDLVTLTPHLFNGPQGIAALRVVEDHALRPVIEGGSQERGLRPGTQPLAAIVGFGVAADLMLAERVDRASVATSQADRFREMLGSRLEGVVFTGHPSRRLPGHVSLCVRGVEAEAVLRELDAAGIEAASGSACTTEVGKPSHVLAAIGVDDLLARGALTFMFGQGNGADDPLRAAEALISAVDRIRSLSPLGRGV